MANTVFSDLLDTNAPQVEAAPDPSIEYPTSPTPAPAAPESAAPSYADRVAKAFVPNAPTAANAPAAKPAAPAVAETPTVAPEDLDAFTDYMYKLSAQGGLGPGAAPVTYNAANASADYKARLVKGNPNTYLAWKANAPLEGKVYKDADTAATIAAATNAPAAPGVDAVADAPAKTPSFEEKAPWEAAEADPGTPATGGDGEDTLPSYMTAGRELSANMTPEERAASAASVPLNPAGTAPEGETKKSFGDWLKDKFGKKADKIDFWDAIEIWGAALAGNDPKLYMAKMDKLKAAKDREQHLADLAEERAFQERLQTLLSDRETQKLLAMQAFEAGQGEIGRGFQRDLAAEERAYQKGETAEERAWRTREAELDRAARLKEAELERQALIAKLAGQGYDASFGGFRPTVDRSAYGLPGAPAATPAAGAGTVTAPARAASGGAH